MNAGQGGDACRRQLRGACTYDWCKCRCHRRGGRAVSALALAASSAALALPLSACQVSQAPAGCPAGQHWAAVNGAWKCSAAPPSVPAIFSFRPSASALRSDR